MLLACARGVDLMVSRLTYIGLELREPLPSELKENPVPPPRVPAYFRRYPNECEVGNPRLMPLKTLGTRGWYEYTQPHGIEWSVLNVCD